MQKEPKKIFLEKELIKIAFRTYNRKLTASAGGNISARLDDHHFLISKSGSSLGFLAPDDILTVNLKGELVSGEGKPSSETPVHSAIYQRLHPEAILHSHPPLISALALTDIPFSPLTFEPRIILGNVPIIPQQSFNIINIDEVVDSLSNNKVIILQHHGVLAMGDTLQEAFLLTDLLETSAQTIIVSRNLGSIKPLPSASPKSKNSLFEKVEPFSRSHQELICKVANSDDEMKTLGRSLNFTTTVAFRFTDLEKSWFFSIKQGKLSPEKETESPELLFSGTKDMWKKIFTGGTSFFPALFQGKITMKGDDRKLARWYLPFQCMFEISAFLKE
ncbi:MAG: class II aldolase/adducin family protein [Proteobacteria bacterium]|nr:class II aldolase/adducin family protein [Pseudomonadota bacterium]